MRKRLRENALIKPFLKKTKIRSRESVKGDIDPKIMAFVDQQMTALRKECDREIEAVLGSLKLKLAQYVGNEIFQPCLDMQKFKGQEGVTRKIITPVLTVNQENVPWVTRMSNRRSSLRRKSNNELAKPFETVLVERTVTTNEDKRMRSLFRKFKELPEQEELGTIHGVPVHVSDILSLSPRGWLSGQVLSLYGAMLKQMLTFASAKPTVHIEDTYFMNYLLIYYNEYFAGIASDSNSAAIVRNRLSSVHLGYNPAETLILIPMNHENKHWSLAVVDPIDAAIYILDSLYSGDILEKIYAKQILMIRTILPVALNAGIKVGNAEEGKEWKVFCVEDIPRQKNTFDCGVFVIAYMDMIARGRAVRFKPKLDVTKRVICRDILVAACAL